MKTLFVGVACALFTVPITSAEILRLECLGTIDRSGVASHGDFPTPRSRGSDDEYWKSLRTTEPFGYRYALDLGASKGQWQRMCIAGLDDPERCPIGSWTQSWWAIEGPLDVMPNTISSRNETSREFEFNWELGTKTEQKLSIDRLTGEAYFKQRMQFRFHVNYACINANQFDHDQCQFEDRDLDYRAASRYPEKSWSKIIRYWEETFKGSCEKMTDQPQF